MEPDLESAEDVFKYIREHTDDIDAVVIPLAQVFHTQGLHGENAREHVGAGAVIKLCSGKSQIISREAAEILLNEGLLNRNHLPIRLDDFSGGQR